MPAFEALIFDLDGVIIDSEPLHEEAKQIVFTHYGIDVPASVYDTFKGQTDRDVIEHVLQTYGREPLPLDEVIAFKHRTYQSLARDLQPVPGALDFIRRAAGRYRLALTTSAILRNQELAFEKLGLAAFFEVIVTAEDITRAKPDPEPYRVTVEKLGLTPEACLVIEDSVNGVRSGLGAGCTVVALTTSFPSAALQEAGAHAVLDGYAALDRWLDA